MRRFHRRKELWGDISLSALLVAQCLITFVAIPLGPIYPKAHTLLDMGHLVFAAVCAVALTVRRAVRIALFAALLALAAGPFVWDHVSRRFGLGPDIPRIMLALTALAFNILVSSLVARHAFGPGQVTAHRIQGAVLVYLNVAALFAIAYGLLETQAPGAIRPASGGLLTAGPGMQAAQLSYFSLTTLTTTGYGDLLAVHPLARSLASLEAVFGQLFPATFLARLVSLHLNQTDKGERGEAERDQNVTN